MNKQKQEEDILKIASYNIHSCKGIDGVYDTSRTSDVILEIGARIVGLQEVDTGYCFIHTSKQLIEIQEKTGFEAVSGVTLKNKNGSYGNALLTDLPIGEVKLYNISIRKREPRGVIDAEINYKGASIRVLVTHLGLKIRERKEQTAAVMNILDKKPEMPTVLMGDVNEWNPFGYAVRKFNRKMGRTPLNRTFHTLLPLFALDRIWAAPRKIIIGPAVHRSRVAAKASDHFPVKAELKL